MAEWECPVCGFLNKAGITKCGMCDYILINTGAQGQAEAVQAKEGQVKEGQVKEGQASARKNNFSGLQINGNELFTIPSLEIIYNKSTKENINRFIADLRIPILTKKPDDNSIQFYAIINEEYEIINIRGLSNAQRNDISELHSGFSILPYDPKEWNTNTSLDSFIAKEFPTCPENTYAAKNPELQTLCRRILEEEDKEGFIIGENHIDYTPKKFLIDNMVELKRCGVTHLFLEHFFYNTLIQRDLRERKMTNILNQTIEYKFNGSKGGYDFRELILSAWANDISVIGIDTDKSYTIGKVGRLSANPLKTKARVTAMNYVARKIINNEKQGKFVVLVGASHLSKIPGGCLGIADILNIPSIYFNPSGEKPPVINVRDFEGLSRVDYVYFGEIKKHANFKGGRKTRKYRLPIQRDKTKVKSRPRHKHKKKTT